MTDICYRCGGPFADYGEHRAVERCVEYLAERIAKLEEAQIETPASTAELGRQSQENDNVPAGASLPAKCETCYSEGYHKGYREGGTYAIACCRDATANALSEAGLDDVLVAKFRGRLESELKP